MYITIDIGATNTRIVSFNSLDIESEIESTRFKTNKNFDKAIKKIIDNIHLMNQENEVDAIGISHVGSINQSKTKVLSTANLPTYSDKPIVKILKKEFTTNVLLENDSICAGLGEFLFKEKNQNKRFLYMTISTGLGAVFLRRLDNKNIEVIMSDIGHTMVAGEGRKCTCGRIDCIESYVSGKSLSTRYLTEAHDIKDLRIWEKAVDYLSVASTNLITMFEPDIISFGGGMIENNEYIREKLKIEITTQSTAYELPDLYISNFGDKIGIYGALGLIKFKDKLII